jgi:iron complex outermembrane receptor protein
MTTRKPGDEFEADLTAGVGTDSTYKGSLYLGGPIGANARGSIGAYTRKTDGQWENLKLDCDDCVDKFEEYGVTGRLLFEVGGGELDFKAKYSEIEAGAINFNASIALADAAAFLGIPAFYEDPNEHNFRYISNIEPQNEQENVNLSLKGDWDLGFATLTGYIAYNDQTNYFLTDGTSDAFCCSRGRPARRATTRTSPIPGTTAVLRSSVEHLVHRFHPAETRRPASCRRTARPPVAATSTSSVTRRT